MSEVPMYRIEETDGLYDVVVGGVVVETFYSVTDAQDYMAGLIWERDIAFDTVGVEFDEPWLGWIK